MRFDAAQTLNRLGWQIRSLAGGRHWAPKMGQALTHATCLASTSPAPPFRPTTGAASPSVPSSARPMRAAGKVTTSALGTAGATSASVTANIAEAWGWRPWPTSGGGARHHGRTTSFPLTTKSNRSSRAAKPQPDQWHVAVAGRDHKGSQSRAMAARLALWPSTFSALRKTLSGSPTPMSQAARLYRQTSPRGTLGEINQRQRRSVKPWSSGMRGSGG